jgi:hypothetical protein
MRAELTRAAGQNPPFQFSAPAMAIELAEIRDYALAHRTNRALVIAPVTRTVAAAAGVIVNWRQ